METDRQRQPSMSISAVLEALGDPEDASQVALQRALMGYSALDLEGVVANYSQLEALPNADAEAAADVRPAMTLCIPLAINREDPKTITTALNGIARAQKHFGKDVDVIIWANAKYTEKADQAATAKTAEANYALLRDELAKRDDSGMHIRTALQVLPASEATMSQLRANYMDAVAMDAAIRGLGYEHPVMWIDADTTRLSKDALAKTEAAVRNFDVLFAHPNIHYSADWTTEQKIGTLDAATKAIVIHEIVRRQFIRQLGSTEGYVEESGLTFAIGTYLEVGGVDTSTPYDEEFRLTSRAARRLSEEREKYPWDKRTPDIHFLPDFITQNHPGEIKIRSFIPGTTITMVGRRQYERVRREGPAILESFNIGDYDGLFVDTDWAKKPSEVTEAEFQQQLRHLHDEHMSDMSRTPAQKKIVELLWQRLFPDL